MPLLGVRGQLMLFLSCVTLLTLVLVWALVTYWMQPQYNRHIHDKLETRLNAVIARIDASESPISNRSWSVLELNLEFWQKLDEDIQSGVIDTSGCCIDTADTTLRHLVCWERISPCLLHESSSYFTEGGVPFLVQENYDTPLAIRLRNEVFAQGSLYTILESGGTRQMVVGRTSADGSYSVIVSASLAQIDTAGEVLASLLPTVALFLLAVNLLAALLFSRWFTRPLLQLAAGARQIAGGNYDVRVDESRRDEVGLLGREFNHMAGEVKHAAQLEKEILANVSHDLRTPLTLIKGYAETVRDITGDDPEKRAEQCSIIVDETDRLSGLVNSVLELSKVSSGAQQPNLVRFDMSQLCFEVAGRYDALCDQNHWQLKLEADKECPVLADPGMMERVLHNLLGNATHHIGPDGLFFLRAIPLAGGGCRVEVEDHGPGIPPEELPNLFDRYYRARSDEGKAGTGLGLSITKAILQQHGFAFGVRSEVGKGSVFWFDMIDTRASH